ncbi:MAG: ArgR family transcriptional regulator [Mangrovibacterium sp.]|nr:ArgR family transcriptional regulator [Mangrovibacterium sp.]
MKNRAQRQLAIRKIIGSKAVHSQEELLTDLHNQGFALTQATLSRDLKTLEVARVPDGKNGYRYQIQEGVHTAPRMGGTNFLADGFRDIRFSGNLAVIRTRPGYASSIAAVLDGADPYEILGTIAGDDTILLVMREGITPRNFTSRLIGIMPKLKEKMTWE